MTDDEIVALLDPSSDNVIDFAVSPSLKWQNP
jgi:hypothetical protein